MMKRSRKYFVVASLTAATTLGLGVMPAHAAEGTWTVAASWTGCTIYQQVELQGSPKHDYMRWYTPGNSQYCSAWIIDYNTQTVYAKMDPIPDNSAHYSSWVYDGPGRLESACADTQSGLMCGPEN